jgi:mono/diheme cytochrome c family protein
MQRQRSGPTLLLFLVIVAVASCAEEEYPASLLPHPSSDAGTEDAGSEATIVCRQTHAQSLPARLVAMSNSASSAGDVVLVSDIFQRFLDVCGACHGPSVDPPGQGGFQITTATDFPMVMTPTSGILAHVTSAVCPANPSPTSPVDPMPPCASPNGGTYAQRSDTDPVKQFAVLVQEWWQAGSPASFTPSSSPAPGSDGGTANGGDGGTANAFALTPAVGNAMTNIGNCVPSGVRFDDSKSQQLDAMFAGLKAQSSGTAAQRIGLPEHLGDTDLFTLESATLAKYGVLAYAPAYPLWSDNAGKLRHVRVPKGTSIHFDKATQQFSIPPNTRFYKTFMKKIVDTDGSYRYRKIETRLIVSRPDQNNPDGTVQQTALFGTYRWKDDESDAVLVETPLRSGEPFADTLLFYNTDEPLAANILRGQPAAPEEALLEASAGRHYAIPSSQRCIECHMGSPSQSFVLGFTPVQINRRPVGVGGVIEAAGPDELTQLQRFLDAGIVTGIDSPSDVLPLERSQGDRLPRNNYELVAQGYLVGNCQHCHNPRGFPTVQNPVLKDVLDFLPSATGGIFQFPLERYSPRIGRGLTGSTPIPYVTPSLVDLPRLYPGTGLPTSDIFASGSNGELPLYVIYAPWRSLVYRNVDAGFAYTDDFALYPHMPFNTPGYDPRAKQILSDWMVSIPAVRKHPELVEYAYQWDATAGPGDPVLDWTPQPYVEVLPGAPQYEAAVAAAQQRLTILHTGKNPAVPIAVDGIVYSRYADPGEVDDILDPAVTLDPICHPIPAAQDNSPYPLPEHPHWVNTDLSDPPGAWQPRQSNWPTVLVEQQIPAESTGGCMSPAGKDLAYADQVAAVGLLQQATLDQVRAYATTPVPFGTWEVKSGCNFSSQPTVQSFAGQRPHWMDVANPPPTDFVYSQTPGAAVFKMICINCHGPKADSNGRLAQNLATMTGGLAAVADFRDGLFGPTSNPGSNIQSVFGTLPNDAGPAWTTTSADDHAARYMSWMALGGTSVNIPVAILELVAATKVLDQHRFISASQLSANMLSQAKALCLGLLGPSYNAQSPNLVPGDGHGYLDPNGHLNQALITLNGDAELWMKLCSTANPHPVHVVYPGVGSELQVRTIQDDQYELAIDNNGVDYTAAGAILPASQYPPGAPIGNDRGGVDATLQSTNEWPWCVDDRGAQVASGLPVCPDSVKAASDACKSETNSPAVGNCFGNNAANAWAVRGAINAGMSIFLYVQSIEGSAPPPDYDQCEQLK